MEIPLRDPAVSRRHALLRAGADAIYLEDAGSRGGIRIGGARVDAPLPLRGTGEIGLGGEHHACGSRPASERSSSKAAAASTARCGRSSVPTPSRWRRCFPARRGVSLTFAAGARIVRRPDVSVRVDGHFIGPGCDLVHGDVIEIIDRRLRSRCGWRSSDGAQAAEIRAPAGGGRSGAARG